MIPVGTPVTVGAHHDNYLHNYGMSREDLVVLAHSGHNYGLGPAKNDPAKAHSRHGWIFFANREVTPKPQESKTVTKFKAGDKVEFIEDYAYFAKTGDRATVREVVDPQDGPEALIRFEEAIEAAYASRLKLVEEPAALKVGDRVTVKGWEINRQNPTWEGRTGVVASVNSTVACIAFEDDKTSYKTGGFEFRYLVPAEEPKLFTFKDIQVGDTIRRTLTRKSGATEVREGTVDKVGRYYAEDDSYILAYDTDTADATDVTLELLNRPEPEPVKKPWEDAERGTVIKRGPDHIVRNAGGWLFIYSNGNKVQRSQKATDLLLRDEKDLQVTLA